jgi:predicted secreted protein
MLQIFLQGFAVYFIVWWMTLFAVLPIGLRTQAEDNDIVLGTVHSAPSRFRSVFVFSMTTLISAIIYGLWYVSSNYFGWGFDALPQIGPSFSNV